MSVISEAGKQIPALRYGMTNSRGCVGMMDDMCDAEMTGRRKCVILDARVARSRMTRRIQLTTDNYSVSTFSLKMTWGMSFQ